MGFDYKKSGVDIEAGDALVDWLASEEKRSQSKQNKKNSGIIDGIGGFASLYRLPFSEYKKPLLVTCTDGVGTKVLLASKYGQYEGIGQDLVAMCVNDLICTGGDPYLFLDYYATGALDLRNAKQLLSGIKRACEESDCVLVGGETAEMPGVYHNNDFDCAGFAVGLVDEDNRLGPHRVQSGDLVVGIASSGFHSNGYSLLRQIFEPDLDQWIKTLLVPTRLYVRLVQKVRSKINIHAIAHITGGGVQNISRVIPDGLTWHENFWKFPEIFIEVQKRTNMTSEQMRVTLNCGVGLVLIIPKSEHAQLVKILTDENEVFYELGEIS